MQIDELDVQRRKHLHRSGAPQKEGKFKWQKELKKQYQQMQQFQQQAALQSPQLTQAITGPTQTLHQGQFTNQHLQKDYCSVIVARQSHMNPLGQKQDNEAQQSPGKDICDTGPAPNKLWRGHDQECCGIYDECCPSMSDKDLLVKSFSASNQLKGKIVEEEEKLQTCAVQAKPDSTQSNEKEFTEALYSMLAKSNIPSDQLEQALKCLAKYRDVFSLPNDPPTSTPYLTCKINTGDASPVAKWYHWTAINLRWHAPGVDKPKPYKYQRTDAKSPGKFKVPRLPSANKQQPSRQQPLSSTSQRYSGAPSSSYKSPLCKSQSTQKQQYSGSTSSGSARRQQGRDDHFQTLPHTGIDRGMAEAKSEEVFKGILRDPMEAKETGKAKAETGTCSFTIQILNRLADAMEAKEAKTKAKMEFRCPRNVGHPVAGKLQWEIDMQIEELDDQQHKHLHRDGGPQRDKNDIMLASNKPLPSKLGLKEIYCPHLLLKLCSGKRIIFFNGESGLVPGGGVGSSTKDGQSDGNPVSSRGHSGRRLKEVMPTQ
uniref:Uncharacterized protein n=1 Tax=Romanomermis culicivorax TaxID=13658 RepID=A0A915JCX4_ROMCU